MSHALRCVEHDIHVLNLPSHTTHLLQVADISVFGPFKTYIRSAEADRQHTSSAVIKTQHVAAFTRLPWEKATERHNICAGFKKAGIYPFDRTKITAKIYKAGVLHRKLYDDSSRQAPKHVVPPSVTIVDPSPSSSPPSTSPPPVVESIDSILALPAPIITPPSKPRQSNTISTKYAVMLTEEQIVDTLRKKQEKKQEEAKAAAERKRKREENKQQKQQKQTQKTKKRKTTGVRLADRLRNKENIPPTSSNNEGDPYAINTK